MKKPATAQQAKALKQLRDEHDQLVREACDCGIAALKEYSLPQYRRARKILEAVKREPRLLRGKLG
jgi:hypothetical protein